MSNNTSMDSEVENKQAKNDDTFGNDRNEHHSKKSIKKNYFYNVAYQLFSIVIPVFTMPYVSRVLGADGVGRYSFAYSICTYFTLFASLGFASYAQREIAKYQDDKISQTKVFWEICLCRLLPSGIAFFTNLLLCLLGVYGNYTTLMFIFLFQIGAVAFDITFLFQGNEDFGKIVLRNTFIRILPIVLIFLFVKSQNDLWIYALVNSAVSIGAHLSLFPFLKRYLVKIKRKELKPFKHLIPALILFIPTIATSIYLVLDKILIGVLVPGTTEISVPITGTTGFEVVVKKTSDLENGYYEQAEKIVKMIMVIITSIGTVVPPRNSYELENKNYEKVRNNLFTSSRLVFLIGMPLSLGLIAIAPNMVPWFFGDGYEKVVVVMRVLSPLIVIIGFSNVFGVQCLLPAGKDKSFAVALCAGAIINLFLNIIFIPSLFSVGAAIATICAELVITILMAIMIRRDLNFAGVLLKSWKSIVGSLVMFAVTFTMSHFLAPSVLHSLIIVISGVFSYAICLLVFREEMVIDYLKKLLLRFKKRTKGD